MAHRTIHWTPEMDATLDVAANANLSRSNVARKLGVSVPTLNKRCEYLGLYWPVTPTGRHISQIPAIDKPDLSHDRMMAGVTYHDVDQVLVTQQRLISQKAQVNYAALQQ